MWILTEMFVVLILVVLVLVFLARILWLKNRRRIAEAEFAARVGEVRSAMRSSEEMSGLAGSTGFARREGESLEDWEARLAAAEKRLDEEKRAVCEAERAGRAARRW